METTPDTITRSDIAEAVFAKIGLSRRESLAATNAVFEEIIDSLANGHNVELRGFGSFHLASSAETVKTPPGSAKVVTIPARLTVRFRPGKDFKRLLGETKG